MLARKKISIPRNLPISLFAAAVGLTYGLHLFGVLRIVDDAPLYLSGAVDLATGRGYYDDHMPRGYSHALATLDLVGLGCPAGIVGLNLVSALGGLICAGAVLRRELDLSPREATIICLLSCSSWMWIYLVAVPMSEMLFFFLSSGALAMLSLEKNRAGRNAAWCLLAACILSFAAFFVRTIGAALFVPVALALFERAFVRPGLLSRRGAGSIVVAGALCLAGVGVLCRDWIASPWYARAFSRAEVATPLVAWWRLGEMGEIARNFPSDVLSETRPSLPADSVSLWELLSSQLRTTRYLVGIPFAGLVVLGIVSKRAKSPLGAYLAAYLAILCLWPFESVRFWAPVLPFLLALAWAGLQSLRISAVAARRLTVCYSLFFVVCGSIAMSRSLERTFIGREQAWNEYKHWLPLHPQWLAAFDRFHGDRPKVESRHR